MLYKNDIIHREQLYLVDYLDQNNFKSFKYNGGSDSLSYEYLWSPLAEKLLTITPSSIAPNTITLFSLIMLAVVHFLYMFTGDNSNGPEGWKLWMMGLTILIYQNLDNLDGKQARKTSKIFVIQNQVVLLACSSIMEPMPLYLSYWLYKCNNFCN